MKIALLVFNLFFVCGTISAQVKEKSHFEPKVKIDFTSCEENNSHLSILNQYTPQDELIMIISHLGKNEKKQYSQRRLHNAKTFLTGGFRDEFNRQSEYVLVADGV